MYPNIEYLNSINMSKVEFERMSKMSSWATCSITKEVPEEGEEEDHANELDEENADESS
jgi:tRNA:m4X modification enzyme